MVAVAMGHLVRWNVVVIAVCALACSSSALVGHSAVDGSSGRGGNEDLAAVIDRNTRAAAEGVIAALGLQLGGEF